MCVVKSVHAKGHVTAALEALQEITYSAKKATTTDTTKQGHQD